MNFYGNPDGNVHKAPLTTLRFPSSGELQGERQA